MATKMSGAVRMCDDERSEEQQDYVSNPSIPVRSGRLRASATRPRTTNALSGREPVQPSLPGHWLFAWRGRSWEEQLLKLGGLVWIIYTISFTVLFIWTALSNLALYGPTPASYTQALLAEQSTTIQVTNQGGTILVTLIQKQQDGSVHAATYVGPTLDESHWDGDVKDVVGTAQVENGKTITIHLTGNINYFHLLFEIGRAHV